jgi:acyl dehydratase
MAQATQETDIGTEIYSEPVQITREMMRLFSDWNSIHVDKQAARALGFPDVVVEGLQLYAIVCEMLSDFFKKGWPEGGKISIRFLSPVWPDDILSAKGVVRERKVENGKLRITLRVWLENQWRLKVAVGSANGVVAPS